MIRTLRALALLLDYPSESLKTHFSEVREALETEGFLKPESLAKLRPLMDNFEVLPLLELQMNYSELFDNSRALSLHFFEHIHGESRDRGQAMLDLGEEYIERGFYIERDELPDFIPMFLEFTSCLTIDEARDWLSQPSHVFAALKERLQERDAEYAGIFDALLTLIQEKPDPEAVRELVERAKASEKTSIDEVWEEEQVTFMASQPHKPVNKIVDRLKAAGKLIVSSSDT
ncbi:nitrate reductase molybdenum cofactor assembly chaperone [Microbulbifer agarilyticus]|uniref:nitrate reductase molybdenum cofactor assembly chaperone n=1 Tax=Microbulbifer agarilyticus TaxID=260552 RepID=UPI001CD6CCAE|nr:nitrate reductase molybdenum cofactor assembly chaperone [Microbulbifer agarilyticus]MCA0899184.1 nitrate reductase molybdenum cofactor assembly chaperone [Microbulbifer agarilyticus]